MSQIARVELKQCTVVEISSLYFVELPLHYKIQRTYFHYCITDILNMLQNIVYLFYTLLWKESESSGVDVAPSPGLLETWHLHLMYYYCAAQSFTLQYDTVQYSTVQYGTVQYLGRGSGERLRLARERSWDWRPGLDIGYRQKSAVDISIGLVSVGAGSATRRRYKVFIWPPAASHRFMRRWRLLLCCAGIFPSLSPSLLLYSRGLQSRKHVYECPLIYCHSALTPVCIPSLSYCSKQPCLTMTQTSCSLHYRYLLSTLSTLSIDIYYLHYLHYLH